MSDDTEDSAPEAWRCNRQILLCKITKRLVDGRYRILRMPSCPLHGQTFGVDLVIQTSLLVRALYSKQLPLPAHLASKPHSFKYKVFWPSRQAFSIITMQLQRKISAVTWQAGTSGAGLAEKMNRRRRPQHGRRHTPKAPVFRPALA